uniref:L-Fucosyltransferase n=1 Tax=Strigamia maritima TaxID=126957 RepID=T1JBI3_STRMM
MYLFIYFHFFKFFFNCLVKLVVFISLFIVSRLNEYSKSAVLTAHRGRRYGLFLLLTFFLLILYVFFIQNNGTTDRKIDETSSTKTEIDLGYTSTEKQLLFRIMNSANYTDNLTRSKGVMSIKYQGRLGNLMGEYATLYALAKSNKRVPFLLLEMHKLLNIYFDLSIPALDPSIGNIPWIDYVIHDWMSPEYDNILGAFVKLRGYPCSWTFYHHLRKEISREFTFKQEIITEAQNQLQQIVEERKTSNVTFVGVRIRRGDYIDVIKKYHGVLADEGYLKQAFAYYRNKYSNVVFVVCSDDLEWCKNNINNL